MSELHKESIPAAFTGLASLSLAFIVRQFFRPYLVAHSIDDNGICHWMPSFFFVTGLSLLLMVVRRQRFETVPVIVMVGAVVFQLGQYLLTGVPDRPSLVAALLAGGLMLFVSTQYFEGESTERINR